jgi:DNA repair photolyase
VDAEAIDALPGLASRHDLVRSVQTPEFAGITFHEVLAKSALNHVPGSSSALPFGWTINPYRGCSHACVMCVDPETLVLMGDGRQLPIWMVRPGDEIYGTVVDGAYRRYVKTRVLAQWNTRKHGYRITLGDGTEIIASADHRFLTDRGWKFVRGAMSGADQRPYLTLNNKLMGFGLNGLTQEQQAPLWTRDYRRGYLAGMIRGDGMILHKDYVYGGRVRPQHQFRLALTDHEALNRSRYFLEEEGIRTQTRPYIPGNERHRPMTAIHTQAKANVAAIEKVIAWPRIRTADWHAGFLGGIFDAEGSCSNGVLRIANKNLELIRSVQMSMRVLGVTCLREGPNKNGVSYVRVTGGQPMRARFFALTAPAISRKLDIAGRAVKSGADLRVVSIEDLGVEMDMIDIQTGTGDFIANGVISHNCFARKTHEYLDFDSGKDFDTQIVVKVNVAEVLARELARPGWERHPVALGTNTDPYQRAEGRYRLMPGIIAALAASDTPFSILTKGTLLRRDIPLLQAAAERVPVDVAMTIDVFDPALRESIEPGAPTTEARLATVRAVRDAGLNVSVFLMPVFPYLTDSVAHLDRALSQIADAGAGSVAYSALHLRPGAREWFWAWLEREHPGLVPRYREVYGPGSYAAKEYRTWLAGRIRPLLRRHGLERQPRIDPATGVVRAGAIAGMRRAASGADLPGAGLIAAELPAHAAAGIQPTLF